MQVHWDMINVETRGLFVSGLTDVIHCYIMCFCCVKISQNLLSYCIFVTIIDVYDGSEPHGHQVSAESKVQGSWLPLWQPRVTVGSGSLSRDV